MNELLGRGATRVLVWVEQKSAALLQRFFVEAGETSVQVCIENFDLKLAIPHVLNFRETVPAALCDGSQVLIRVSALAEKQHALMSCTDFRMIPCVLRVARVLSSEPINHNDSH
ncbi:hypothetical protein [Luteimonas deserti]|uniref:Uncharacterized protein n=1 Tax=Luteimonas deserti TaxID=2752306 RepID=A0A7Z0QTD2_9GAMM|nr:hypothetical protein [Luteimonas deserti]NYZ63420.1 hypothetical protein [Luteimonas deserti]